MTAEAALDVLIVGAGLAGLAAARDLRASGRRVRVLDKSRGVSGRAATRRVSLSDGTGARLDHGARFFTARHDRTQQLVQAGLNDPWLREWARGFALWEHGTVSEPTDGHPRYVPWEGMSALGKELAHGLEIQTGVTITRLERQGSLWEVSDASGVVARAPTVILNVPAPQLGPLLTGLDIHVPDVEYAPAWAAGIVLRNDIEARWPALELRGHPVLEWIAREHTKRPAGHPPALVLQATPEWSRANLERTPDDVLPELLEAARRVLGDLPDSHTAFAHRWRYATPTHRAPGAGVWDATLALGLCGDSFTPDAHGPRVEAALLSGWWLAEQITA
ncbi:FAD-binding protein [Deinococcus sp. KSM4-11]|uniref:NAD(P)/FAD-dependent oxidoreductase n=1 Tax=Deinococcus sp. KSM4-11 TaxID=2568654 RepID=UPI0010A5271B|nr:NAD(P)-binding protein [Deinococcus sp. KSM4-11]THF86302.1 FAD-binding protein [Deinococcus sp. KSM4-11]